MPVTIYKNLFDISTPFYREIGFVLDRIRKGTSKDLVSRVRGEKDPEKQSKLKEGLPSVCFSGKFSTRTDGGLIEHSGFMCLDFDKYDKPKEVTQMKDQLCKDPYTYSVFVSPGGLGLKCIVKVPKIPDNHRGYFESIQKHYNSQHFDSSSINISRVCFESYDPKIFINEGSKVWDTINTDSGYTYSQREALLPLTNEGGIIDRLMKWFDKNYSMSKGNRNRNAFVLACALNDYGVRREIAKGHLLQFESKDFSSKEIEKTIRSAYSKTEAHGSKYFEDTQRVKQIKDQIKSGKDVEQITKDHEDVKPEVISRIAQGNAINVFWFYNSKGKISVDNYKYKMWLQSSGFFKFYPEGSESFILIRIENNLIDNTTEVKVKDFVLDYLLRQEEYDVYQYMTNQPRFFKDDMLNTLDVIEVSFKADTKDVSYLYFKNCALEVTSEAVKQIDYIDLEGFVWKKHIIDFDYTTSSTACDFSKFIYNISGQDAHKELSMRTTIGKLLSSFKNASSNVATVFNDEMISENPNGGTGKGIITHAVSKLKRTVIIDGKSFDFKKSFPYQLVSADCQVLVFDDVHPNFQFENIFSVITEGLTLEKKNKDAIKIPASKSPNVVINTNYALKGVGNSFDRRKWEMELAQHYNIKNTPVDEFGRLFFDDWDKTEWNKFYSYMIGCLQLFLKHGLVKTEFKNLKVRQFIAKTTFEFYEWTNEGKLDFNEPVIKSEKYDQFISDYPDFKKWLSRKRFGQWLEKYAEFLGIQPLHGNTNGQRWIQYNKEGKPERKEETLAPF